MTDSIVAYIVFQQLDRIHELPEDPLDREYGEAESCDVLIYNSHRQSRFSGDELTFSKPYDEPEPVEWLGFFDRFHQTDFLECDLGWTLISKRMLYTLHSVGSFSYKAIPTRIYDYRFLDQGRYNLKGQTVPLMGEFNEDYVGLQLLEHLDVIDYDRTEFKFNEDPVYTYIPKLVLREPVGGFPPIFRLTDRATTALFVSPTAKETLEEAGIKGLRFFGYEGTRAEEMSVSN